MVRNALEARLAQVAITLVGSGKFSDLQLQRLDQELAAMDATEALTRTLQSERVYVLAVMGVVEPATDLPGSWRGALGWPVVNLIASSYLDYQRRIIEASRQPWPGLRSAIAAIRPGGPYHMMWDIGAPSLDRAVVLMGRNLAQIRSARLATVVERYRLVHARAPTSLSELQPAELPSDPFDGRALKYKADKDRYVIYSVGEDGSDDGGDVEPRTKGESPDTGFRVHPR